MDATLLTLLGALAIAVMHVVGGKIHVLDAIPRSRWLSFAGGVSVSYVFLHLMPELNEGQRIVSERFETFSEYHASIVWVAALIGLIVFYGLERLVALRPRPAGRREPLLDAAFWLSISSFTIFNVLIGYITHHRHELGRDVLGLFIVAMVLHYLVTDRALRERFTRDYDEVGRWVLAGAVLAGWVLGEFFWVDEVVIFLILAFLSGGAILNIIKEELPEERNSRYSAFLAGALTYGTFLLLI
jgi:hypothetical protein